MTPSAAWEPEHHNVFVDLCVEQKMSGNQPRMQHILELFQERTGARFTIDELMNHWDTMIKQWKIWCRLVQCRDMKWDPQTNTFGASDQEWANYLEVNPEAGQYRCNPPLFLKKLAIIFAGINLDGEGTSGSSQRKRSCEHRDEENDTGNEATISASNIVIHDRCKWSSSSHAIFIDLCLQEYLKGNKPVRRNEHYPKGTWKTMLETINQKTGVGYTQVQLKNHFEVTRRTWRHWCQTIGSPIMKWDTNTGKFGATDEDWKNYLKENDKAAAFRRKHIPHAAKLATIFKGRIEPGKCKSRRYRRRVIDHHSQSPQLREPAPSSEVYTNEPVTGSDNRAEDDDNNADDAEPTPLIRSDSEDVETVTPGCHRFNTDLMEKIPMDESVEKEEYTIGQCMECLDAMEEVEKGCDLYMFALDLFLTKEDREIFLLLTNSSLRMSWLLRRRFDG